MLVWHAPSVSSRICSTKSVKSSQESLQTAKRKEKKDKVSCKPRKKSVSKTRFQKGQLKGRFLELFPLKPAINSEKGWEYTPGGLSTGINSIKYVSKLRLIISKFRIKENRFIAHKRVMQIFLCPWKINMKLFVF